MSRRPNQGGIDRFLEFWAVLLARSASCSATRLCKGISVRKLQGTIWFWQVSSPQPELGALTEVRQCWRFCVRLHEARPLGVSFAPSVCDSALRRARHKPVSNEPQHAKLGTMRAVLQLPALETLLQRIHPATSAGLQAAIFTFFSASPAESSTLISSERQRSAPQ